APPPPPRPRAWCCWSMRCSRWRRPWSSPAVPAASRCKACSWGWVCRSSACWPPLSATCRRSRARWCRRRSTSPSSSMRCGRCDSGGLDRPDEHHLEGVQLAVVLADRDVFTGDELFLRQPEAGFVVVGRGVVIVEAPAAARTTDHASTLRLLARALTRHRAERGVFPIGIAIDAALGIQRQPQQIAVIAVTVRMLRLSGQLELDDRHVGHGPLLNASRRPPRPHPDHDATCPGVLDRDQASGSRTSIIDGCSGSACTVKPSSRQSVSIAPFSRRTWPSRAPTPSCRA